VTRFDVHVNEGNMAVTKAIIVFDIVNLSIIPEVSKCLILMWTVASDIPIYLAISTNDNDESLLKMRTIFKLISSKIIPSTTRI
jgi:hypothetical protein